MIRIMNAADTPKEEILSRAVPTVNVEETVAAILAEVKRDGDAALFRLTELCERVRKERFAYAFPARARAYEALYVGEESPLLKESVVVFRYLLVLGGVSHHKPEYLGEMRTKSRDIS